MDSDAPCDVVALFHATFHPTKGNIIDWCRKSIPDLNLDGVEFSSLPSGLHLVEADVIHFTCQEHQGVCIFRRRVTADHGERGARLGALGVLVAKSSRPRPWLHLQSLKLLSDRLEDDPTSRNLLEEYYKQHAMESSSAAKSETWTGWADELSLYANHPMLRLPQLLRLLGPTTVTYIKHVLAHKRVLIYTHPSAELACQLAIAGSEICFGQDGIPPVSSGPAPSVLGMVGLIDMQRLEKESEIGHGWIACTTDRLFLEKPHVYDLLIDLTTPSSIRAVRPTLAISRKSSSSSSRQSTRLIPVRFTFSDLRLWAQLERILTDHPPEPDNEPETPPDLYEGLCMLCVGMWSSASGRGGSPIRITGPDTPLRNPVPPQLQSPALEMGAPSSLGSLRTLRNESITSPAVETTLALLFTLHTHIDQWNARLDELVARDSSASPRGGTFVVGLRDVVAMDMNPLSDMDCSFVGALVKSRVREDGKEVVVKRTWRDLLGMMCGW